jgi:hypothetical protein
MEKVKRVNSAVFKAQFSEISEDIKRKNLSVIVQKNNKDHVAVVSIQTLKQWEQDKQNRD